MNYLILRSTINIPTFERNINKIYAYHPILSRGDIVFYRLKQKFYPNIWQSVYYVRDPNLLNEIKVVYEYLMIKYS